LPKGTHEYERFIKPSELRQWGVAAGLQFCDISGIEYSVLNSEFTLGTDVSVNYLMHFAVPA
jgi:2-polyprenyl-6-hydroxyphenyl methylase/3-demethylubiquinone-9 3-methyltransferase